MTEFADDLIKSLSEAVAYARGDDAGARTHITKPSNVRAIHRKPCLSELATEDQRCNKAINPSN